MAPSTPSKGTLVLWVHKAIPLHYSIKTDHISDTFFTLITEVNENSNPPVVSNCISSLVA